jgi:hypothetical protein
MLELGRSEQLEGDLPRSNWLVVWNPGFFLIIL